MSHITYNTKNEFPIPTFHCNCGQSTEGFSICLKCDPQTYTVIDSSNANLGQTKKGYAVPNDSVYSKEIWNAGIEAAANVSEINSAANIRKLKK